MAEIINAAAAHKAIDTALIGILLRWRTPSRGPPEASEAQHTRSVRSSGCQLRPDHGKPQPNGGLGLGPGNRALSSGKCDESPAKSILQVEHRKKMPPSFGGATGRIIAEIQLRHLWCRRADGALLGRRRDFPRPGWGWGRAPYLLTRQERAIGWQMFCAPTADSVLPLAL